MLCDSVKESRKITLFGTDIFYFKEVTSTNDVAKTIAKYGALDGTMVVSETQTAGKGRLNRQWSCPSGKGLLMSIILRKPPISIRMVPQISLLAGVAVVETLKQVTGCHAGIKWPNDVIMGGKKVCGILSESVTMKSIPEYIVVGIGINANQDENELPLDCRATSTSLRLESGEKVSRVKLLKHFIEAWGRNYQSFCQGGYTYLRGKWMEHDVTLGRIVTVHKQDGCISGLAADLSMKGGLVVLLHDGSFEEFLAEDVSLGRIFYQNSAVNS